MTQQQPELLDVYRASLKSAVDLMKTSLESAERLQNQQLAAIRSALAQQSKAVAELSQAKTMDELMAVQTRIAGAQIERIVGLWFGQVESQMTQAREWFNEAAAQSRTSAQEAQATAARVAATAARQTASTSARR